MSKPLHEIAYCLLSSRSTRFAAASLRALRLAGNPPGECPRRDDRDDAADGRAEKRTEEEQRHVSKWVTIAGLIDELKMVDGFMELIRGTSKSSLAEWLTQAEHSPSYFIRTFAKSIRSDESAVSAAMTTEWSNGPVEGHVNRL
jgi:transposase